MIHVQTLHERFCGSQLRVCSFHAAIASLPSSSRRCCHFLTQVAARSQEASMDWNCQGILLHLRLFMFALFSSPTHPQTVHHQDVLSFSCPLTHHQLIFTNTTHKPPHTARNGIQALSHRPRRPPYGHRSAGNPDLPREFSSFLSLASINQLTPFPASLPHSSRHEPLR